MSEYKLSFLLKFGKEEHINQFADESLYCSSAITFWGIEKALKIKGQGDVLEAGSRLFTQKMAIFNWSLRRICSCMSISEAHFENT